MNIDTIMNSVYEEDKKYWEKWIELRQIHIDEIIAKEKEEGELHKFNGLETMEKSLFKLMKEAVACEQYRFPTNELSPVMRIVKFRIELSIEEIKKVLGIETISVYGIGLFTKMEGLLLSPHTRTLIGYDNPVTGVNLKKKFSEEIIETYEFRLATPAMGGLFVPKKSPLTRWIGSLRHIEYYDINLGR